MVQDGSNQAGLQADGGRSMNEALRLARADDLPRPLRALELAVLGRKDQSQGGAPKKEAKRAEDQIARIEADAPVACTGCTVSAPALMSPGMQ
jgi:hypothetical protein